MIFSNNAIFITVLICDGNADDTDGADFHRFFFNNLKIHLRESASSASSAFPSHPVPNKNPSVPIKILRGCSVFRLKIVFSLQVLDNRPSRNPNSHLLRPTTLFAFRANRPNVKSHLAAWLQVLDNS